MNETKTITRGVLCLRHAHKDEHSGEDNAMIYKYRLDYYIHE